VIVYVGSEIYGVKWCDYRLMSKGIDKAWARRIRINHSEDEWTRTNVPYTPLPPHRSMITGFRLARRGKLHVGPGDGEAPLGDEILMIQLLGGMHWRARHS